MIDKYTVVYDGEPVTRLNPQLVLRQGISDEGLEIIKAKHCERLLFEECMDAVVHIRKDTGEEYSQEYEDVIRKIFYGWQENQFQLQFLWGFPQDVNYHNSYILSPCTCTNKLDNMDSLGSKYRWHNQGDVCPIHHPKFIGL